MHRLGIREVRFTGGEPLMRRDLEVIVAGCSELVPGIPLSMTTNAVGLEHRAVGLARAGLSRVNVSLDTIDRRHFAELTRRDRLESVLTGIRAAQDAGLCAAQDQCGADGRNAGRCSRSTAVVPRRGVCATFHRGDAARRGPRVGTGEHGGRADPARGSRRALRPTGGGARGSVRARRGMARERGPGDGRNHRVGHPIVLRGVRPHQAHRGGDRAFVLVQRPRGGPAGRPALRRRRRDPGRDGGPRCGTSGPDTASTRRVSSRRGGAWERSVAETDFGPSRRCARWRCGTSRRRRRPRAEPRKR